MRRLKWGPMEQFRRRKCRLRNHMTSKVEQLKRRRYRQRKHGTSKEGVRKRKNHKEFKQQGQVEIILAIEEELSKI
jgi:hypothetical protein